MLKAFLRYNHFYVINVARKIGRRKLYSWQETSMIRLEVMQTIMRSSMEVMVIELGVRKERGFWSLL